MQAGEWNLKSGDVGGFIIPVEMQLLGKHRGYGIPIRLL
jgi:hypothetical protein